MRGMHPLRIAAPGRGIVAGTFTTVNGSSPTAVQGRGWSVARDGEGLWTVTLTDAVQGFDAIVVTPWMEDLPANGTNENVNCVVDQDSVTTQAFQIELTITDDTTGAGGPSASDEPGTQISFIAIVRLTSVSDPQP